MFEYVVRKGGLKESEARWFFQQLIIGVDYLHRMVQCWSCMPKTGMHCTKQVPWGKKGLQGSVCRRSTYVSWILAQMCSIH